MNVPWKNFISPWWRSASDATVRFPVPPMPQVDELRREPWPTIVAQTSSQLPALPISSGPPQGGLLASLNGGTSGGVLERRAGAVTHERRTHTGHWLLSLAPQAELGGGGHAPYRRGVVSGTAESIALDRPYGKFR
jgi:hypothetical protein